MDSTDILIEHLRRKLDSSRSSSAESILKPAPPKEPEPAEPSDEDIAALEATLTEG